MTPTAALQAALTDLTGPTFGPTDPGYDAAKRVYNAMIDKSPALIVQAHTVADVVAGVNAARDHECSPCAVAVTTVAVFGTCDDGLVIDLAELHSVEVDPAVGTVQVGGGCAWGQVEQATGAPTGSPPRAGILSTTGVGGLTLGGGLGP